MSTFNFFKNKKSKNLDPKIKEQINDQPKTELSSTLLDNISLEEINRLRGNDQIVQPLSKEKQEQLIDICTKNLIHELNEGLRRAVLHDSTTHSYQTVIATISYGIETGVYEYLLDHQDKRSDQIKSNPLYISYVNSLKSNASSILAKLQAYYRARNMELETEAPSVYASNQPRPLDDTLIINF